MFYQEFKTKHNYQYHAPARINLIGEHIDYNGGKVLPCAISCYITALVSLRDDDIISISSSNIDKHLEANLHSLSYSKEADWGNYVFGMFYTLKQKGYHIPHGLNILVSSNIPLGSGLSSSAALLDLIGYLISDIFNLKISNKEIASLAQNCENSYCGLKSGIMDEAAIALGKANKCMLLDCAKFKYEYFDMDLGNFAFVVLKTNKPRKLTESKYNERVEECNLALNILKKHYNVSNLCELSVKELDDIKNLLNDEVLYKRVKHVVSENDRVYQFVKALKNKNLHQIADLLNASHYSLKNDYEVSGMHLDTIVEAALTSGAIGSRMTGAGFGGCAIALINKADFDSFSKKVKDYYYARTNLEPEVFMVDIVDGPKKVKEY